jgi:hypothetical protein
MEDGDPATLTWTSLERALGEADQLIVANPIGSIFHHVLPTHTNED